MSMDLQAESGRLYRLTADLARKHGHKYTPTQLTMIQGVRLAALYLHSEGKNARTLIDLLDGHKTPRYVEPMADERQANLTLGG